jgi:D-proline reductase (dithiol) PrdB
VIVDSYRFLPRSFIPMYENAQPLADETAPVWAAFEGRLADASIALVTSAGLYIEGEQEPFDLDRERAEPTWGDPTHRVIPHSVAVGALGMCHLHVNNTDVLADRNVALPIDVLDDLVAEGRVGSAAPSHVSVMGFQAAGLDVWRKETAPAIIELLRSQQTTGVVLAPV